jgi:hypothetical protein
MAQYTEQVVERKQEWTSSGPTEAVLKRSCIKDVDDSITPDVSHSFSADRRKTETENVDYYYKGRYLRIKGSDEVRRYANSLQGLYLLSFT